MGTPDYEAAVDAAERAELPVICFGDDIALRFRVPKHLAPTLIRAGMFGPWLLVRGEPVVLRGTLEEHLRLRTMQRREEDRELISLDDADGLGLGGEEGGTA